MTDPKRLTVIFNPTAGGDKRRRLQAVLAHLRRRGCQLDLRETTRAGDAERFAAALTAGETDLVVAAGGDGTINEVINGLLALPTGTAPPLGIIPLGTANVLALELKQGLSAAAIARTLTEGTARPLCVVATDQPSPVAPDRRRHFLLMAGAGFDAHVVANVRLGLKRHTGKLAYVVETLLQAVRYEFPTIRLEVDGHAYDAATAVVCNGRLYGGPFTVVPDGNLEKPTLRIAVLTRKGYRNVFRYAIALALGRLPALKDVEVLETTRVRLINPAGAPLQADGDSFGALPLEMWLSDRRVDVVFPPQEPR